MLEIYNENLRDLLADGRSYTSARLEILATQASGCNVPGATQVRHFAGTQVPSHAAAFCNGVPLAEACHYFNQSTACL